MRGRTTIELFPRIEVFVLPGKVRTDNEEPHAEYEYS